MLDVMSMSQFLLMMGDVLATLEKAGVEIRFDWMRYVITRYDPGDVPETRIIGFIRKLFGEHVLAHPMLKSVAISDAGMTKQTLYEVERRDLSRNTYDRAMDCLDAVNGELERLIHAAWHRQEGQPPETEREDIETAEEVADVA
jgi:chromosome partitioning protein